MTPIHVSTVIDAEPAVVWRYVRDVASHVEWMHDAESITFHGDQREGVGTRFACVTRVGPIATTDEMEITEWEDEAAMGVRHDGLVTGEGRFSLTPAGPGRTEFRWDERLDLPWWMVPPVAARVLEWIWHRNLARLKQRVETGSAAPGG